MPVANQKRKSKMPAANQCSSGDTVGVLGRSLQHTGHCRLHLSTPDIRLLTFSTLPGQTCSCQAQQHPPDLHPMLPALALEKLRRTSGCEHEAAGDCHAL